MDYRGRQQRMMEALARERLGGLLVTHLPNIRYLCGFTGSAGVLVILGGRTSRLRFFTDGRYTEQARGEIRGAEVIIAKGNPLTAAVDSCRGIVGKIGFEAERTPYSLFAVLKQQLGTRLKPTSGMVEALRMRKEPAEVAQIRAAVELASTVFVATVGEIVPGMAETAFAAELEFMSRRLGAEAMSFHTIVASGARSALPHGRASNAAIARNGFVIIDFGVILGGYCSDMTRTVHVGKPDRASIKMYNAVLAAQLAGIKAVKPGVETSKVDYEARKVLAKAGFGRYFTHSTGHGVGLEIHEAPSLRKRMKVPRNGRLPVQRLESGMVITIEPGAYVPSRGGVRIEDMVLVTDTGCEVLTPTSKELIVL